ncbi:MAG TPA: kynureninase [Stellaceae bacterium]|nr:kynureninase [Stellaceae bacterium]
MISRSDAEALDRADPLAHLRDCFLLPEGVIYLDGNSLGPLPKAVPERLQTVLRQEWGEGLIRSWNEAHWIELPHRVGAKIAPLIGAASDEVVVTDSTSVNLFKLLAAALAMQPGRRVILSERGNFPTDLYIAEGARDFLSGGPELRLVASDRLIEAMSSEVAVFSLTEVDFRTGYRHDMRELTAAAHRHGILTLWDLSHSVGAMPVRLDEAEADLAIGCGYKYLNGGPGAPAFLYVRRELQGRMRQPLEGWMGHRAPFEFDPTYAPAGGIARMLCGTPPVLSMAALDAALELWRDVDLRAVRAKSVGLADLFITLIEANGLGEIELASPRVADRRGSQVSFRHREAYAVVQALIAEGVIGDFRAPDLMRFGLAPLYLRHIDVFDAALRLVDILRGGRWDRPEFRRRRPVT